MAVTCPVDTVTIHPTWPSPECVLKPELDCGVDRLGVPVRERLKNGHRLHLDPVGVTLGCDDCVGTHPGLDGGLAQVDEHVRKLPALDQPGLLPDRPVDIRVSESSQFWIDILVPAGQE